MINAIILYAQLGGILPFYTCIIILIMKIVFSIKLFFTVRFIMPLII